MNKVSYCECGLEITTEVEDLLDKGYGITCYSCGADILSREDRAAYSYLREDFSIVTGDPDSGIWLLLNDVPVRDLEAAFTLQAQAGGYQVLDSAIYVARQNDSEDVARYLEASKVAILKRFRSRYIDG